MPDIKLDSVIKEVKECLDVLCSEKYEELKKKVKTYGELLHEIEEYRKSAVWLRDEIAEITAKRMKSRCVEEMEKIEILPSIDESKNN